jgi:phosphonate transport system substrate-binding protein
MRSFVFIPLLLISFHACGACLGDQKAKDHPYSFYVLPQLAISETYRSWTPVLERVGKKIEMCFDLYVPQGFNYFEEAVKAGKADFAFMNPYHMMMAKRSGGYLPVIAGGKDKISGIVVVKNDGTINKLEELDGKKMAFPAPLALGATLLVRAYLAEKNIHVIPEYVKSHSTEQLVFYCDTSPENWGFVVRIYAELEGEALTYYRLKYCTHAFQHI